MALYLPLVGVVLIGSESVQGDRLRHRGARGRRLDLPPRPPARPPRPGGLAQVDEVLVLSTMGVLLLVAGLTERACPRPSEGSCSGSRSPDPSPIGRGCSSGPMRDLFAAMFFFFFALRIDLGDVPPVLMPAIALIAIACVAKTATGWIVSAGLDVEARLRAGTCADRPRRVLDRDRRSCRQQQLRPGPRGAGGNARARHRAARATRHPLRRRPRSAAPPGRSTATAVQRR